MQSFLLLPTRPFTLLLHPSPLLPSRPRLSAAPCALKSPRGFGPPTKKSKTPKQQENKKTNKKNTEEDDEEGETEIDVAIPEVVTNRMMKRMGLSVGIPLTVGMLFFPFFYYLKAVAKLDVPTWIPFLVSFVFFGAALLGITYGIVSASWDPLREGSLLGWNEARKNWPVFRDSLRSGGDGMKK